MCCCLLQLLSINGSDCTKMTLAKVDSVSTVQTRNNTPAPPPMRPHVASAQLKTRIDSNSSKDSGSSPKLRLKDPVKILCSVTHKVTKEVNKAIKRQSTYDPDHTELHPPRSRSASSRHATSVEQCPSKRKLLWLNGLLWMT